MMLIREKIMSAIKMDRKSKIGETRQESIKAFLIKKRRRRHFRKKEREEKRRIPLVNSHFPVFVGAILILIPTHVNCWSFFRCS